MNSEKEMNGMLDKYYLKEVLKELQRLNKLPQA
jgi:hypothetical protein